MLVVHVCFSLLVIFDHPDLLLAYRAGSHHGGLLVMKAALGEELIAAATLAVKMSVCCHFFST